MTFGKAADEFVVRAVGADVDALVARSMTQMSYRSTRQTVRPEELESKMAWVREIAPG